MVGKIAETVARVPFMVKPLRRGEMDFRLSTEHEQVRDKVRRFCQAEILPLVAQAEKVETFPVRVAPICKETS
jgi:Acyl-CoA dehydrogenase, N-terminal domain